MAHRLRIYVDTSVIGGCLDDEFADESMALLDMARRGEVVLLVSDLLVQELQEAPAAVRERLTSLPLTSLERVETGEEAEALHRHYVAAGMVGPASDRDALHVATATVARADLLVSWNFKHLVHHEKIRGFNAINHREGYPMIAIFSPKEVV